MKSRVIQERFECPDLGTVTKQGEVVDFSIPVAVTCFKDMQDAKIFLRQNRKKIQRIITKYCEMTSHAKKLPGVVRKENEGVKAILQKLGYIDES